MQRAKLRAIVAAFALFGFAGEVWAQDFGAAFSDFDTGSDNPIQIEADRLEVRDPQKLAIYSGHVRVRQGATILEAPELRVFYTGQGPAAAGATAATSSGPIGSKVSRIEAGPGVNVRSGDRTASGERAVFDLVKNLVTLEGNVVLTQGQNVVRGERVVVNLTTKEGRVEGGRVQTLITPSAAKGAP
jgi:lipopolysaccharide export system protein LptA